ncbi:MAG: serpin family protein [Euzebya sp.]
MTTIDRLALVGIICALLVAACAEPGAGGGTATSGRPAEATSQPSEPVVAVDPVDGDEIAVVVDGMTELAVELYTTLTATQDGNVLLSPYSITDGLALPYLGAAGPTAQAMADTLGFTLAGDTQHRALATLRGLLADRQSDQLTLRVANRLYADIGLPLADAYLADVSRYYGAGVGTVDYADPEAARAAINGWVAEQTADRIEELFPAGTIDATTRLALVNAIYLDAAWHFPFNPDNTSDGPFTTASGEVVTVPMMHFNESLPSAADPEGAWVAVQLPYAGEELRMVAILPQDLATFEAGLTPELLDEIRTAPTDGGIHLAFPRAELRFHTSLIEPLRTLGMGPALVADADFSGITGSPGLIIQAIEHEVFMAIDEEGTEAAAATGTAMADSHGPTIEFNRPYLVVIQDDATGAILFFGRVTDPTG